MTEDKAVPGVIAPPPLILLFFIVAGLVVDQLSGALARLPTIETPERWFAGGALISFALFIVAVAVGGFRRAGTPVPTREPTSALVTAGIHALSRNPIYVGFFLFYLGIAVSTSSYGVLALFPLFALAMRYGVVAREERYLEQRFGDDYRAYKARVPRWL